VREYYEKVSVPQAPEEPDERVDRMTGLPYDMQAGGAFVDEEDRMGFSAAGLVTLIKRLTRSADDVVDDIRPTTRVDIDDDTRNTLLEFRSNEPENFVDPEDVQYSSRRVSADNDGNRIEYRQPNETYFITKKEVNDRLSKEFDDEINNIPEEDIDIVQEYFTSIPKASGTPPPAASVTKQEFLKDSVEQKPQYNGSFFSTEKYDNPLSVRLPRELGLHVGTKGQAETILMRGAYPFSEDMVERVAARMYMDRGMTEQAARVAVSQDGVPDEVLDFIMPELMQSVPTGVTPSLREGFINVKNPLVLDTDMINWNPAKFLGGYDPDNTMRLSDQAQSFVDALEAQVKIAPEQFTSIVDTAATQIDSVLRKKDLNAGKLLNAAYDHRINTITRRMLEDLGFDSIQYKNLGELARVSEKQAGGNSYILFRDDQFVTEFAEDAPIRQAADDSGIQFTTPEYEEAYKKFDEIDDVKEWQDSVKAFVKSSREINPDIRTPELEQSARDLLAGKIDRSQHLKNIDNFKPVRPFTELPREPSDKSLIFSHDDTTRYRGNFIQVDDESFFNRTFIHEKGADKLNILPNTEFKINKGSLSVGDKFRGRLQIPSYTAFDSWVIAGTGGPDKGTTYAKALWYEGKDGVPVNLRAGQTKGERIATGQEGKVGYATVDGWIKSLDVNQIRREADRLKQSEEWTQVGFDPRRQTKFYVRDAEDKHIPVLQGDEVIQIGPLVLVKNAVLDRGYQGLATGGRVLGRLSRVTKQDGGLISRILNAITNRKASSEENREMFKDGADDFRWGETRDNKYYVNHEKFKSSDSGPDYEREVLFGEALHSLKDLDPERYERIYNSAMNDPEMVNRLKEAQVFEGQQDRDFNEYVRNTRLDQIIGGYLTASPNSNVPTMRDRNFQRDSNIYGSGQFRTELETLAKDLNMTSETNPFFTRMSGE
jgi:hypothetical protein